MSGWSEDAAVMGCEKLENEERINREDCEHTNEEIINQQMVQRAVKWSVQWF